MPCGAPPRCTAGRRPRRRPRGRRVDVDREAAVGGRVRQELLDEREHLVGSVQDVRGHRFSLVRAARRAVMQELGAHLHPAEVVLQVVRQDAQKLVLVLGELLQPVPRPLERQVGAHPRHQLGLVEGLRHVVDRAGLERAHDERLVVRGRQEDDRDLGQARLGADALAHLESVHLGHQHVEQDEVGRGGGHALERLLARGDRDDLKAKRPQHVAEHLDVRLLVVDHQNPFDVVSWGISLERGCGAKGDGKYRLRLRRGSGAQPWSSRTAGILAREGPNRGTSLVCGLRRASAAPKGRC